MGENGRRNNPKYNNKQRAKDYDTAIRSLQKLRDQSITDTWADENNASFNNSRILRLEDKKSTDRRVAKAKKYATDNKIMALRAKEAIERYSKYDSQVKQLVDKMSKDNSLVYTTRLRTRASTEGSVPSATFVYGGSSPAVGATSSIYSTRGTDYVVRAKTKSRSKSKKYNDPNRKREYATRMVRTDVVYV